MARSVISRKAVALHFPSACPQCRAQLAERPAPQWILHRLSTKRIGRAGFARGVGIIWEAETETLWSELAPQLDEALNRLEGIDRQALLQRFFDGKRMRDLGQPLGVSEDAAKMRINRPLDRLRGEFEAKGVVCPAVTVAALLGARAVEAAPAALLARLAGAGYSASQSASPASAILDAVRQASKEDR